MLYLWLHWIPSCPCHHFKSWTLCSLSWWWVQDHSVVLFQTLSSNIKFNIFYLIFHFLLFLTLLYFWPRMNWILQMSTELTCLLCQQRRNGRSTVVRKWYDIIIAIHNVMSFSLSKSFQDSNVFYLLLSLVLNCQPEKKSHLKHQCKKCKYIFIKQHFPTVLTLYSITWQRNRLIFLLHLPFSKKQCNLKKTWQCSETDGSPIFRK